MAKTQVGEKVVLEQVVERFIVAEPITEQKELYGAILELRKKYLQVRGINAYLGFNEETGQMEGSNPLYVTLANKVKGIQTITHKDGMVLDKKKKLTNGVYRDCGLVIYSPDGTNTEVFPRLIKEVQERGLVYPVLVHPVSLDLDEATGEYKFSDDNRFIVSGEEARRELEKSNYRDDSGVRRLYRDGNGSWYADWGNPFYSDADGRVDWKRGEATRANLEADALAEIDMEYQATLDALSSKREKARDAALRILRG